MLRDYQKKILVQVNDALKRTKRVLVVSPTGSGKTFTFSFLAKQFADKGKRVLIITHRQELLSQSDNTLTRVGLFPGILKAGTKTIPNEQVVVSMVETLYRRVTKNKGYNSFMSLFSLVIVDESHRQEFNKIFAHYNNYVVGFTATAYRRSPMKPLKDYYDEIVIGPTVKELIKEKHLVPSISFGRKLDMSKVGIKTGEYDANDLESAFKEQATYSSVVKGYKDKMMGGTCLAFAPSISISETLVAHFNKNGIPAAHVDGTTSNNEREKLFSMLKNKEIKVLSNVQIADTGFDYPELNGIIEFFATRSLVKHIQILGRGARVAEGKKFFIVLDYGNNIDRFGFYEDDREWSLELDTTRFKKEANRTKICPSCESIVYMSAVKCPHCGYVWEKEYKEQLIEEIEVELKPLKSYEKLLEYIDGKSFLELEIIAELRGYKKNWIFHQLSTIEDLKMYAKYKGYKPQWVQWMIKKGWKPKPLKKKIEEFNQFKKN